MSKQSVVAKRYARALFEVAQEHNEINAVEEQLRLVVSVVEAHNDYQKLLHHPNIDATVKIDLLKQAFGTSISDTVSSTIALLIERGRESALPELLEAYVVIANDALGQANAIAYTPFALSDSEAEVVAEQFGKLTGKKIRLEHVIDKSLLGGLQIRIGDRKYDGSLSGKLARLHKSLDQNQAL